MSREHVELNKFDWDTTDKSLYMTMIDTSLTKSQPIVAQTEELIHYDSQLLYLMRIDFKYHSL